MKNVIERLNRMYELNKNDNEISCIDFINKNFNADLLSKLTTLDVDNDLKQTLYVFIDVIKEAKNNEKKSKTGFRADIGQNRHEGIFSKNYLILSKPIKLWFAKNNGEKIDYPFTKPVDYNDIKLKKLYLNMGLQNSILIDKNGRKVQTISICISNQNINETSNVKLYQLSFDLQEKSGTVVYKKLTAIADKNYSMFSQYGLQNVEETEKILSTESENFIF